MQSYLAQGVPPMGEAEVGLSPFRDFRLVDLESEDDSAVLAGKASLLHFFYNNVIH
jgi:hypothetical protein